MSNSDATDLLSPLHVKSWCLLFALLVLFRILSNDRKSEHNISSYVKDAINLSSAKAMRLI